MAVRIVMKPGILNLARHAYEQDCLFLNLGKETYKWADKKGWLTSDSGNELIRLLAGLFIRRNWTKTFLKKSIQNEENLRLAINESGADLMVPHELFVIENESYIIK